MLSTHLDRLQTSPYFYHDIPKVFSNPDVATATKLDRAEHDAGRIAGLKVGLSALANQSDEALKTIPFGAVR